MLREGILQRIIGGLLLAPLSVYLCSSIAQAQNQVKSPYTESSARFGAEPTASKRSEYTRSYDISSDKQKQSGRIFKARYLPPQANGSLSKLQSAPIIMEDGSSLTLVTPQRWAAVGESLIETLRRSHGESTKKFGEIPPFRTSVRLLDEETFYLTTGAPSWTNAMYYKGQITIPLPLNGAIDQENLHRSVKHEYTHAIIHSLSGGRCPGWLDEGLAQWAEGAENPALRQALKIWLESNKVVPLRLLQGGFTKLETRMVPAAYAQSLYSAEFLIENFGSKKLSSFFHELRRGSTVESAFSRGFSMNQRTFENFLAEALPIRAGHGKWDH